MEVATSVEAGVVCTALVLGSTSTGLQARFGERHGAATSGPVAAARSLRYRAGPYGRGRVGGERCDVPGTHQKARLSRYGEDAIAASTAKGAPTRFVAPSHRAGLEHRPRELQCPREPLQEAALHTGGAQRGIGSEAGERSRCGRVRPSTAREPSTARPLPGRADAQAGRHCFFLPFRPLRMSGKGNGKDPE